MKQLLYQIAFWGSIILVISNCKKEEIAVCPDCPVITKIAPASGAPGTLITITGRNFSGLESIIFDGNVRIDAIPDSTTSQRTSVVAPDLGKNGPVKIQVVRQFTSGSGGSSSLKSIEDITFTYVQGPSITNFAPTSGKKGDEVTITGRFFGANPRVFFANAEVSEFILKTDTLIRVKLPAKAGSGLIRVTTSAGATAVSSTTFTYNYKFAFSLFLGALGQPGFLIDVPAAEARLVKITQIAGDAVGNVYIVDQYTSNSFDVLKIDREPPHIVNRVIEFAQGVCTQLMVAPDNLIYVTTNIGSETHLFRYTATQNTSIYSSNNLQQAALDASGEVYLFRGGVGGGIYQYTGSNLITLSNTPVYTNKVLTIGNEFLFTDNGFKRFRLSDNTVNTLYDLPLYSIHSWAYSPAVDRLYFGTSNTIRVKNGGPFTVDGSSTLIPELSNVFAFYMGADASGNLYIRKFDTSEEPCLYKATLE